jgi:acetyl-CoA carboxylase alpha subunit
MRRERIREIREGKRAGEASLARMIRSPDELRAELSDARVTSVRNLPKIRTADVATRIHKLRVIEYVEELSADLERLGFRDGNDLRYSEISVVETWAMEESAVRRAEASAIRTSQNPRY